MQKYLHKFILFIYQTQLEYKSITAFSTRISHQFVEVETTQSANRESVQTTSVTPDLIIPKELKSNRICLSNKDSPSELNGIQGKTQNWNPYTPSSLTNTEIVTNCRNKGEQDIDKPVDLCAPFKGGFLISAQPIFEHYKQISTAEIHPLKVRKILKIWDKIIPTVKQL